jgi:hypothetical protein
MGFLASSPSPTQLPLRPLPDEPSLTLRPGGATLRACSALAVPPGSDGFLRSDWIRRPSRLAARRFVAPCSQPWGPLRFRAPWDPKVPPPDHPGDRSASEPIPGSAHPSKRFPPRQQLLRHRGPPRSPDWPVPLVVGRYLPSVLPRPTCTPSTSGICSTEESVLDTRRCRRARVDAPMGFGSTRSCLPRFPRGWGRTPPARIRGRLAPRCVSGPESPKRQSFSALSGSEDPCDRRTRRCRDPPLQPR